MASRPRTTSRRARARPRETVSVGTSAVNASDIRGLQAAWRRKDLALFLGAGVSIPYGIPSWKNLVLELLFDQTQVARRLRGLLPHYRRALASWLTEYFEYDPVILARVVKTDIQRKAESDAGTAEKHFLEGVRSHLYRACDEIEPQVRGRNRARRRPETSLEAVADLVACSTPRRGVAAVVTFNFDDLLERALDRKRVRYTVVSDGGRPRGGGIPIVHPHGYLQQEADDANGRVSIVFTEDDYHRLTDSAFHWALTSILGHLRNHTALVIGLSMSDPNLRRLLDAAHTDSQPAHWQVQKRHEIRDNERALVHANIQDRARKEAEILGVPQGQDPVIKDEHSLSDAVNAVLRQADSYDRELFESMGVKTIWLEQFDDIPALLRLIAQVAERQHRG